MKTWFKKMMIFLVACALVAAPIELLAASKSSKRVHTSQKKHLIKTSSRVRAQRIKVKLRQQQLVRAESQRQYTIQQADDFDGSGALQLASSKALIINQNTGEVVYAKNTNAQSPIASITKLMTAMVILDVQQPLNETIYVTDEDIDYVKGTSSRLYVGASLTRGDMLQLALMASENRAASSLASNYPGGRNAFVRAMNTKAKLLGLTNTHFVDPTGLESSNVSTAEDLVKMVQAAYQYQEIRMATTSPSHEVYVGERTYPQNFNNTNSLVRGGEWQIGLSKTGYISEAGRCLVMQAKIMGEPLIIVFLDSVGKYTRIGDANRLRKWMEHHFEQKATTTGEATTVLPRTGTSTTVMAGKVS